VHRPISSIPRRPAADGHLLATTPGQFSWEQLASDGSYVATGTTTALTARSTSGQALFSRPGDYSEAMAFSTPGAIQIALGAAGQNVIGTVSTTTGTSTISPSFQGTFKSWFVDGAHFLTTLANTVWTYSSAGVQQDIKQLTGLNSLGGQGNWFWTFDTPGSPRTVNIYQVGASATAAFTEQLSNVLTWSVIPSINTTAFFESSGSPVTVIDLSGVTPVSASYTIPVSGVTAFTAVSSSDWPARNGTGIAVDGASLAT
jgi:hypothetical protein